MTERFFVDTNLLVYARDASEPEKQRRAMSWMTRLWEQKAGRLSFQVLNEFYVTVTQKLQPGLDVESAREEVRLMLAWDPLRLNGRVAEGAWRLQDRYRLSWWDALIASSAQLTQCRYLLSEDFQANQNLGDIRVVNPFLTAPG